MVCVRIERYCSTIGAFVVIKAIVIWLCVRVVIVIIEYQRESIETRVCLTSESESSSSFLAALHFQNTISVHFTYAVVYKTQCYVC